MNTKSKENPKADPPAKQPEQPPLAPETPEIILSEQCEVESDFLDRMRDEKHRVQVYLLSGARLVGFIDRHDARCILLRAKATQIVYKTAITAVLPIKGS